MALSNDGKNSLGAWCWALGALTMPAQVIAAARWPQPYSWTSNLISDLGVTACGSFDQGTRVERWICSPAHLLANGSTVLNGALLAVGAVLLWSAWPRRRTGHWAMGLLATGGVLVMLVGFLPWDLNPEAHNLAALIQGPFQWAGMLLLALSLRGNSAGRWMPILTAVAVLVSLVGFVLFLGGIGGGRSAALGVGTTERIAFDTLTLWSVAMGLGLLRAAPALKLRGTEPARAGS